MEDKEKNTQIPVIRLDRQLKYEGNILKIYEDKVLANGHEARWDFIHHDGAAAVLPVADDGKSLWCASTAMLWTVIPGDSGRQAGCAGGAQGGVRVPGAGGGDRIQGESPENLELPYELNHNRFLLADEAIDNILAHNLIPSHQNLDEDEVINVVPCSLGELEDMIYTGKITEARPLPPLWPMPENTVLRIRRTPWSRAKS